jgi:hypothetical protein
MSEQISNQRGARLAALDGLGIVAGSSVVADGREWAVAETPDGPRLAVFAPTGTALPSGLEGATTAQADGSLLVGPRSAGNLALLRAALPWLRPQILGLQTSAGLGDRLGLATPGHVRAVRAVGGNIAPIFAQQSIREMTRTGRSAQDVMDDAVWGVFAESWQAGFGADADHLKTPADVDACVAAGYTFFTVDPGEHVDDRAETADARTLQQLYEQLPWDALETTPAELLAAYAGRTFEIEVQRIAFGEPTLIRAAVKYARAVAHVAAMFRHLRSVADYPVELEVSVDETETVTSHAEHVFIASELRRLGVEWVSLAPRYIGRFEKGVDYIGDLDAFAADFGVHAAIARVLGPYKLSLHSGSDKFSVYPIAAAATRGLVHLKTAGTSYLEALHTLAVVDPAFFRAIYVFGRERYETDRASYHVSADLAKAPLPADVADADLVALLDQFDAREILHVTFGSVLTDRAADGTPRFADQLMALLRAEPELYAANLQAHFERHLRPFVLDGQTLPEAHHAASARNVG